MNILFLCVANSARSQMAEGIARKLLGPKHTIQSAGSEPKFLHPLAIQALKEIDIDISHHKSKSVDSIEPNTIDLVITLCAEEVCPMYPKKVRKLHWGLPDPAAPKDSEADQFKAFQEVRDRLIDLMADLKKTERL